MTTQGQKVALELRQLRGEIEQARASGTMSVLRDLQSRTFKFLRDRESTKHISLDDLRMLRGFLRDPFTIPRSLPLGRTESGEPEVARRKQSAPVSAKFERKEPEQVEKSSQTNQGSVTRMERGGRSVHTRPPVTNHSSSESRPHRAQRRGAPPIESPTSVDRSQSSHQPLSPTPLNLAARRTTGSTADGGGSQRIKSSVESTRVREFPLDPTARGRYSTFIEFDPAKGHTIRHKVNEWLTLKGYQPRFGENFEEQTNDRPSIVTNINVADLAVRYSELRIVENTDGMFTTVITMGISSQECWVCIDVESANNKYPAIPKIARSLLALGVVDNSELGWHHRVQQIDVSDTDRLFDYLISPERLLPVFVVGTLDDSKLFQEYCQNSRTWYTFAQGTAVLAILTPEATVRLSSLLPESFIPSPWSLRTYLPHLNTDDPNDSRRHRFIGQYRISSEEHSRTRNRLGRIASEIRAVVPRPPQLARAQRAIERAKNRQLLAGSEERMNLLRERSNAIRMAPPSFATMPPGHASFGELENLTVLRDLLGVQAITEDLVLDLADLYETRTGLKVQDRLDDLLEELTRQREEADQLRLESEYHLEEALTLESDLKIAQSRLKFVQRKLSETDQSEDAYSYTEDSDIFDDISSFTDLEPVLQKLGEKGLVFTGDVDRMLEIDEYDSKGQSLARVIKSLRCLIEYREEWLTTRSTTGLFNYLSNPTGAYAVGLRSFAPKESESTMNQYGSERLFSVPREVDESGTVKMEAHFKLGQIGMRSPRMYVLDDLSGTGTIIIGYIGSHLTTVRTN